MVRDQGDRSWGPGMRWRQLRRRQRGGRPRRLSWGRTLVACLSINPFSEVELELEHVHMYVFGQLLFPCVQPNIYNTVIKRVNRGLDVEKRLLHLICWFL